MEKQWGIRVRKQDGEEKRQEFLRSGILDFRLRPRREENDIIFPVITQLEGAELSGFEARPATETLSRHELIGGIAVMQERDAEGAAYLLNSRPSIHTVLLPESDIEGEYRVRRFEVLAGIPTTRTRYVEHGLRLEIDLSMAYFSPRLSTERQRILSLCGEGERVLDMFAGVGPFALTLARKAGYIAAVDINPGAVRLMLENIALNRAGNVLPLLCDASRIPEILPGKFDRVVMNLPIGGSRFLPQAVRLCRPGGTIHCYALVGREGEILSFIREFPVKDVQERFVRSYSPGRWHAVYDIQIA